MFIAIVIKLIQCDLNYLEKEKSTETSCTKIERKICYHLCHINDEFNFLC